MTNEQISAMMICEKIRYIREARNKTQLQLANDLKISVTSYAKMERGETDLTLTKLERVCNILRIKPFILFLNCNPIQVLGDKINLNEYI